jgi:hypothetical protein
VRPRRLGPPTPQTLAPGSEFCRRDARSAARLRQASIAATSWWLIVADMPRKPKRPPPTSWNIYKVAKKGIWLGTVEAPDKATAIEKGAQEFKTEAWCLYAVARR